jgi:hypothetical protein
MILKLLIAITRNFQVEQILARITDPCHFLSTRRHFGYNIIIESIFLKLILTIMRIDSRIQI